MLLGVALDFAGFNAVAMLFWSAVVNGNLAPPLIVLVVLLGSDRRIMRISGVPAASAATGLGGGTVMAGVAVALVVTLVLQKT